MHGESALLRWCREVNYSRHYTGVCLTGCLICISKPLNHISFWAHSLAHIFRDKQMLWCFIEEDHIMLCSASSCGNLRGKSFIKLHRNSYTSVLGIFLEVLALWIQKEADTVEGWYTCSHFVLLSVCHSSGPVVSSVFKNPSLLYNVRS